jgi:hypothetical protein
VRYFLPVAARKCSHSNHSHRNFSGAGEVNSATGSPKAWTTASFNTDTHTTDVASRREETTVGTARDSALMGRRIATGR